MALELASMHPKKTFVATAVASDEEMKMRIEMHRKERSNDWITIEEPLEVAEVLKRIPEGAVVIDCLTLWLSNHLFGGKSESEIFKEISGLYDAVRDREELTFLVTNEVGLGIVPENELARRFRDLAGKMNQDFAALADNVIFMMSGLPLYLKKDEKKYADS